MEDIEMKAINACMRYISKIANNDGMLKIELRPNPRSMSIDCNPYHISGGCYGQLFIRKRVVSNIISWDDKNFEKYIKENLK